MHLGVSVLTSWQLDASLALGVMFLFTAVSHFAPMKEDLTREARKADTWYNRSQPCRKYIHCHDVICDFRLQAQSVPHIILDASAKPSQMATDPLRAEKKFM